MLLILEISVDDGARQRGWGLANLLWGTKRRECRDAGHMGAKQQ